MYIGVRDVDGVKTTNRHPYDSFSAKLLLLIGNIDNPISIDYTCFVKKGSKISEMSDNKADAKEEQEIIDS